MSTAVILNLDTAKNKTTTIIESEGARRGMFKVSLHMLEPANIDHVKGLFDDMVVVHTETSAYEGVVRYYAVHPDFEPVPANTRVPEYVVIVDRSEDVPVFHFERVTQESMV